MLANPGSDKALFRAAKAFLALDRTDDALGACDLALERGAAPAEFTALREQVTERSALLARRAEEHTERARRAKLMDDALRVAIVARGVWIAPGGADDTHFPKFDTDALPAYAAASVPLRGAPTPWRAPDPIRTPLLFPVVLLYPEHGTSDLIAEFHEDTTVGMHLAAMFPPERRGQLPWDPAGEYVASNLTVLAATRARRVLRVGHKIPLRTVLDEAAKDAPDGQPEHRDGLVLHNGTLTFAVFPQHSAAARTWIAAAKAPK